MSSAEEILQKGLREESRKFETFYTWLTQHMPPVFFEEVTPDHIYLLVHGLMGLDLQDYFVRIKAGHVAFALCLDSPDADLRILKEYQLFGIKNYRSFTSDAPPPFPGVAGPLRIAAMTFTQFSEENSEGKPLLSTVQFEETFKQLQTRNSDVTEEALEGLLKHLNASFLRTLSPDRLVLALDMFFRAQTRDHCQYEIKQSTETPSLQIVFAWRNVAKHNFLYRMAKVIHRHGLVLKKVNALYIQPDSPERTLLMSVALCGPDDKPIREHSDFRDFLQELVTLKYFEGLESIETTFVDTKLIGGNEGNLLKSTVYFIHQALIHMDINAYSFSLIEEGICRHPELILLALKAFALKFHPEKHDRQAYEISKTEFSEAVNQLDTGNAQSDVRCKHILEQCMNFIEHTLKTNFYRNNKTAHCFRLDPAYLDALPYDRKEKFPELPYAVFFMKGFFFSGFHIRFKDLARGGLRTVTPRYGEQTISERNNLFSECYNLALTQQKKNKDIPEGGAKGVIFLEPFPKLSPEAVIFQKEQEEAGISPKIIEEKLQNFLIAQKAEHIRQAQRSYIENFLTLLNCLPDGTLKAKHVVDYLKKPEYIYLGPDENMSNDMIDWIAEYGRKSEYKPGSAFISSKPTFGINHKEFGVTSYGVNVYMEEVLKYLGIRPLSDVFTVKMSGGPDGDVAGNQMLNLANFYPKTARLLTTIDISGTIFDPSGLDLGELRLLFQQGKPLRYYPPEKLSEGGFLLDLRTKREQSSYAAETLCLRKKEGKVVPEWLCINETNHLLKHTVHQTEADVFIPAGGRPRTLNDSTVRDFFNQEGKPSSKAIIEGANLYLTPAARKVLEEAGVIIVKDSSANKGGVICSSFEVLCGLCLEKEEFLEEKPQLVKEILQVIAQASQQEARLLLKTRQETLKPLTEISDKISEKINSYTYELLDFLQTMPLSEDEQDPLNRVLLSYCLPTLRTKYSDRIFNRIPELHKKAIIACRIAAKLVYQKGPDWTPGLVGILPLLTKDPDIVGG